MADDRRSTSEGIAARLSAVNAAEIFRVQMIAADGDIDALGHVNNVVFVRWIQEVAVAHTASLGVGLDDLRCLGGAFVVARQEVDYLRPALRGDVIEARTWISSLMVAKCIRATELVRAGDGEPLARARTTWGFVDLTTGRPMRVPEPVRRAFAPHVRGA
jgi:acyl-CoA thioester hydrolase